MAKDNVPFHTIVFPATLIGSREPWKLPDYIKAFNWLTYYGGKFSTSRHRGVFMSDALDLLPADYWRYYLMANAPESDDADFSWELFAATVNKDLVGVIGNFVNRLFKFAINHFGGAPPDAGPRTAMEDRLIAGLEPRIQALDRHMTDLAFRKALHELRAVWVAGNVYLAETEPWKMIATDPARAAAIVRTGLNLARLFAALSLPFIPSTSTRVLDALGVADSDRNWPTGPLAEALLASHGIHQVQPLDPLFRRITDAEIEQLSARFAGANQAVGTPPAAVPDAGSTTR
jgi:methionyl-tRNA synthetase